MRKLFIILFIVVHIKAQHSSVWRPTSINFRQSINSDIVCSVFNNGSYYNDIEVSGLINYYKRNSLVNFSPGNLWVACKKGKWSLVSGNGMVYGNIPNVGPLIKNSFVPGVIGDPNAMIDTVFNGIGWKYNDAPNYIVYVSTDYDSKGIDISGNNLPDWPIRVVNGKEMYVHNVDNRNLYPPVYKSNQDIFAIYKDTDTRLNPEYRGANADPDSFDIPIGVEVMQYSYSFTPLHGVLKDMIIMKYVIVNKSGVELQECLIGLTPWIGVTSNTVSVSNQRVSRGYYSKDSSRNMITFTNPDSSIGLMPISYVGLAVLETPQKSNGKPIGLTLYKSNDISEPYTSKKRYEQLQKPPLIAPYYSGQNDPLSRSTIYGTGPFNVAPGDTLRFTTSLMISNSLDNLLLLDDMVKKVYENDFPLPLPPTAPTATVTPIEGGTRIIWDSLAESSIDPLVPDTLGKPFFGYRLYRAQKKEGPYQLIKEWKTGRDSIVHEYTDKGTTGLLNNISYYYKLTSFDEGSLLLDLPPMESGSQVNGVVLQAGPSSPYDLANIRIVPNPFVVTHAAQASIDRPAVFFNYLPDECTIRIYTTALELVAELHHSGGSRAEWNLRTQGGQQVASQLLIAKISTPQGTSIIKKFAVVFAE